METYYKGEDVDLYVELFEDMTMETLIPLDDYNIGITIYNSSYNNTIFATTDEIEFAADDLVLELVDGKIKLLIPSKALVDLVCGTVTLDILLISKTSGLRKIQRCHIFNLEDSRVKHIK